MPDEPAQNPPGTRPDRLLAAVGGLARWLSANPSEEKPHRVLLALVAESEKKLRAGFADARFTADELRAAAGVEGVEATAKKWLDWASVERYWHSRQEQFQVDEDADTAIVARPVRQSTRGGPGNVATYRFELVEVPRAPEPASSEPTGAVVAYERAGGGAVRPALLVRWLFRDGEFRIGSVRSWTLFLTVLMVLSLPAALLVFLLLILTTVPAPVTTSHLGALIAALFVIWAAWHQAVRPWLRLFDDRIVVVEDLLAIGQRPAQAEIYRQGDERFVRLVRYTSTCSICGSAVYLADGDRDFPGRVVGRCSESPREHVFSFDRVTLRGTVLRAGGFEAPHSDGRGIAG
jgi:hypothetical protein